MIRQSGRSASFTPLLRYLAVAAAAAVLTLAALTLGNALSAAGLHLTGATDVTASSGRFPVASAVMFLARGPPTAMTRLVECSPTIRRPTTPARPMTGPPPRGPWTT